ncbi:HAMP domain-containing histidine kinase [Ramlibacter ginsenosidimutans]|uniref:histidine kinase n=1 Tax=Ramlibacter ginsenosidimutans TaxID=502333 RepID=A0A934TZP9_9BURK|nr:HAMP domain-containing sensor histidine kinase [Ramlibacter ginsenosidimutans]MBK6009192.1 HAMP domain-containing histidine kinase [Ramlibacter ginsenosidimutans]
MQIGDFIEQQIGPIVEEWVEFANTRLSPSHQFTREELADHARVLLLAIAADMKHTQGAQATHDKAQGNKPDNAPDITRIAQNHAAQRFDQGFSLDDLISEFRALRASVIRGWTRQLQQPQPENLEQLTRFGESMDQALSASASLYSKKVDDSRNLLLGVLGHDLRTPLGVVHMSAHYLLRADTLTGAQTKAVARILTAAERMKGMVKDILDFTQTALGVALPITPAPGDFGEITQDIVAEVAALHPDSRIELTREGVLTGRWDAARVGQMLANLVANAVQHGASGEPVLVTVDGDTDAVRVQVRNGGNPIPAEARENLFSPLRQKPTTEQERSPGSSGLGLGLYITKEIAVAHGGTVDATSNHEGTTFTVRLPRIPPLAADRRAKTVGDRQPRS